MRNQDASAVHHEGSHDAVVEDPLGGVRVDGAQAVVENQVLRVRVDGTGKRDALLLPAREGDAFLADQRFVAVVQNLQVTLQGAGDDDVLVPLLVEGRREQNVFLDVGVD